MKRWLSVLFALYALSLLSMTAFAQTDRGTVTGRVTDNIGAAVGGATVVVTNIANGTSSTGTTNAEGLYTIPALTVGTYKLKVERTGFKVAEVSGIVITVGSTVGNDIALEVGQVSETVQITSDAAQLKTEDAKISSAVSNKQSN